jgi:hypothetical protein
MMLSADRRFVVSHVGSMVRPPAMIPFLQKHQAGEPYDKPAFEACLADSVIEAVRLQAETGIDVVSDGEYGKSMIAVISGRDREAFPESTLNMTPAFSPMRARPLARS